MSLQKCKNVSDTEASIKDKAIHISEINNKKNFINNHLLLSQLTSLFILYFIPRYWNLNSEPLQNDFLQILLFSFSCICKKIYLCIFVDLFVHCLVKQGHTNFPKHYELLPNSRHQKGDMKQVTHLGFTNIRCQH